MRWSGVASLHAGQPTKSQQAEPSAVPLTRQTICVQDRASAKKKTGSRGGCVGARQGAPQLPTATTGASAQRMPVGGEAGLDS